MWKVKIIWMFFLVTTFLGYSVDAFSKTRKSKKRRSRSTYDYPVPAAEEESQNDKTTLNEHSIQNLRISLGYKGYFFQKEKSKKSSSDGPDIDVDPYPYDPGTDDDDEVIYDLNSDKSFSLDDEESMDVDELMNKAQQAQSYDRTQDDVPTQKSQLVLFHLDLSYEFQNASFFISRNLESWGEIYGSYTSSDVKLSVGKIELKNSGWMGKKAVELRPDALAVINSIEELNYLLDIELFRSFTIQAVYDERSKFLFEWYGKTISPSFAPLVQLYIDTKGNIGVLGGIGLNTGGTFILKSDVRLQIPEKGDYKPFAVTLDMTINTGIDLGIGIYAAYQTALGGDDAGYAYMVAPSLRYWGLSSAFVPYFNFTYQGVKGADGTWYLSAGVLGSI